MNYVPSDRALLHGAFAVSAVPMVLIGGSMLAIGDTGPAVWMGVSLLATAGCWRWALAAFAPKRPDLAALRAADPRSDEEILAGDEVFQQLKKQVEAARRRKQRYAHLEARLTAYRARTLQRARAFRLTEGWA
jgi:hypothetical protein